MMNWSLIGRLGLMTLPLMTACHDFELRTPDDFAKTDETLYDYRAQHPRDVVVAVRTLDAEGASLRFWKEAVKRQMERLSGYSLESQKPVTSKDGTPGVALHYSRVKSGQRHDYEIALFLKRDAWLVFPQERLFVFEATGPAEAYAANAESIAKSLSSLDLDLPL